MTLVGANEQVRPDPGDTEAVMVTAPVKPFRPVTVTVDAPVSP